MDDEQHRVLVADDHPVVREGIRTVLEREGGLVVAGVGFPVGDRHGRRAGGHPAAAVELSWRYR
ncbi:MAG: hypothetical protein ABEJ46_05875 [Gemmatimonadota bacterium]